MPRRSPERKRRLSQKDLQAIGATPGLMAHRVGPDGRARLQQLVGERRSRRRGTDEAIGKRERDE